MLSTTWTKRTIRSESLQPLGGGRMKTEAIAPGIGSALHGVRLSARPDSGVIAAIRAALAQRPRVRPP